MKMHPRKFLALLKANMESQDQASSVEALRVEFEREGKRNPIVDGISDSIAELGGIPCLCLESNTKNDKHILYIHGGGYAGGSPQSHHV